MANDIGPSSWLEGQYDRLMQGIEHVGSPNAPKLLRAEGVPGRATVKEPQISIPAWNDIIKTGPRVPVTAEDWTTQKHFERAGLPSPLAPEIQQSIAERRAIAKRIANSATPEYQRGVSEMVTAVDNVQDAALTLSVAGRITVATTGVIGAWIAPAVAALGVVATFLNWIGLGLILFGIAYALICQGPRDAITQASLPALTAGFFKGIRRVAPRAVGIPVFQPTFQLKGRMGASMFGIPSGRQVNMYRRGRWSSARVGFGELLQIGQTAYDATGYGIALGGLMGLISETAYGASRAAAGETVRVRSPEVNHAHARTIAPGLKGLKKGPAWHREQCARALGSAPIILRDPWTFGDNLYGLTWVVVYACVEPLMWDTDGLPWQATVLKHLPAAWRAFEVRDPVTRGILDELGINPDGEQAWPVAGSPLELDSVRLVRELGAEISSALRRWLEERPADPWRRFVAELAMRTTERLWVWLEGADDWPAWTLAPVTAVWESLFRTERWPSSGDPPDKLLAAWAASERAVEAQGGGFLDGPELDRIWQAHGVPLIRLRTGPAPMPPEAFLPYDPDTGVPEQIAAGATIAEARTKLAAILQAEAASRPQDRKS